jgi:ESS family glutamate:Na+ symporter
MTQYDVTPIDVLMLSILVLYLGMYLTRKVHFLRENYIQPAVSGGLLFSIVVAIIYAALNLEIRLDMQIRDVLLLVFFSTVGLSAKRDIVKSCVLAMIRRRPFPA